MIVRITPAMGVRGMSGQRIIRTRLMVPPRIIRIQPVMSKMSREKKPTMRETRRSTNICHLRSREESAAAESAEIWRKGLKRVRMREFIEKKSVRLEKAFLTLPIKTPQPEIYHQVKDFRIIITLL